MVKSSTIQNFKAMLTPLTRFGKKIAAKPNMLWLEFT